MSYDNLDGGALGHGIAEPDTATKVAKIACDLAGLHHSEPEAWVEPALPGEPIAARAEIVADSRLALEALGLIEYDSVDRAPFQGVDRYVHGSRSSVERHRAEHSALCGPCQRWVEVNDRKHKTGG